MSAAESPQDHRNLLATVSSAQECESRCISKTLDFARAQLGLDPTNPATPWVNDVASLFSELNSELEKDGTGRRLLKTPLGDLLRDIDNRPTEPAVLPATSGHLCIILGAIDNDGEVLYQVIHGDSQVALVSEKDLRDAGIVEAWKLGTPSETIPIRFGVGVLRLNTICHNFGEIKPNEVLSYDFVFENTSREMVAISKPTTSCGCTTTSQIEPVELRPGDSHKVTVRVASANTTSLMQNVLVGLSVPKSKEHRRLLLSLYGNQRIQKSITPTSLDFGVVAAGKPYSRELSLSEVATDRFTLNAIEVGDLPMTYAVTETRDKHGYRTYHIECVLTTEAADTKVRDKQNASIRLRTDSRFEPELLIPITFQLAPAFELRPSLIAFGAVRTGESVQCPISLTSVQDRLPLRFEIESVPDGLSVQERNSHEFIAELTMHDIGRWKGSIKGKVWVGDEEEAFEIPCVAFGKAQ